MSTSRRQPKIIAVRTLLRHAPGVAVFCVLTGLVAGLLWMQQDSRRKLLEIHPNIYREIGRRIERFGDLESALGIWQAGLAAFPESETLLRAIKSKSPPRSSVYNPDTIRLAGGFGRLEGPYPEWNLPQVIWGMGPASQLVCRTAKAGRGELTLRVRNSLKGQRLTLIIHGAVFETELAKGPAFQTLTIPVDLKKGKNSITLNYRKWSRKKPSRPMALLFSNISLTQT